MAEKMSITKFGHSCLLIQEGQLRILLDPGSYAIIPDTLAEIDIILITHEHQDHYYPEFLKKVLKNNSRARIFTNHGVGTQLEKEGIPHLFLEDGQSAFEKGVAIEGVGKKHAVIYPTLPEIDNTGYFIAHRLFYPGDAFIKPTKPVEVLALPVCAPWMRLAEAIDFVKEVKPKICFPVHDGMLKTTGPFHLLPPKILEPLGIKFIVLDFGVETAF